MKRQLFIILGSLIALNSFSVSAAINTVYDTENAAQKNGAIVVNGKLISYDKCLPANATDEQKNRIKEGVSKANEAGIHTGLNPDNLPECK